MTRWRRWQVLKKHCQTSVELGKVLAQRTLSELVSADEPPLVHDSSTDTLIRRYRRLRRWPS